MNGLWELSRKLRVVLTRRSRLHTVIRGNGIRGKLFSKQGELLRTAWLVGCHGYDFCRKTKPPFLLPITMSTLPSPLRSPTENCVPTPESLSMR